MKKQRRGLYLLNLHIDQAGLFPESQRGFRKDIRTISIFFTARQLQEKCQEQIWHHQSTRHSLRNELWTIMTKIGCPPRFIVMVRQFHHDTQARGQNDREYSEQFPVTNRVKRDCLIGTNPVQHDVFCHAFQDCDADFPIRFRFDGSYSN